MLTPAQTIPPRLLELESGFGYLPSKPRSFHLVLLAERDLASLDQRLSRLRDRIAETGVPLAADPDGDRMRETAITAGGEDHRLALIGGDAGDLIDHIDLALNKLGQNKRDLFQAKGALFYSSPAGRARRRINGPETDGGARNVFLFPGQGSQAEGMLDELCVVFPEVRSWIEDLDRALADLPVVAPSVLAFQPSAELAEDERSALAIERISLRGGAELGIVANLALCDLLIDLGIEPDLMVGHSNGENAALIASGILELDRAGLIAACRRLTAIAVSMEPPPVPEGVAAVSLADRRTIEAVVDRHDQLYLSMINCPTQHVIAGIESSVRAASADLARGGALVSPIPFRRAYHTPLFAAWSDHLRAVFAESAMAEPKVPLYSCWSSRRFPSSGDQIRHHASAQLSERIDFQATVERLHADGGRRFIEVGCGNALTGFVNDCLRGGDQLSLPVSRAGSSPLLDLERAIGRLFVDGVELNFGGKAWTTLAAAGFARVLGATTGSEAADTQLSAAVGRSRPGPVPDSLPHGTLEAEIASQHFALMDEFLVSQERVLGWFLEAGAGASQPAAAASIWPLVGRVTRRRPGAMASHRRFTVERDPILGQHSLGPHLAASSSRAAPLAVLPFTFSMEIAAEAALELFGGGVVRLMREIRGTRWLALDRGSLELDIRAEMKDAESRVARVRLSEVVGGQRLLAFEADVEVGAGFAEPLTGPPPDTTPPARPAAWTATDFYRDFAFHGPAFQSICSIEGVDDERIVASQVVPERPASGGGGARGFHLDPGFLDSAGQLVGLWLLENGEENFGIFPFQVSRFEHLSPIPEPGASVRAVAEVRRLTPGITEARVVFVGEAGPIYRLNGLRQRYLPLPRSLVGALMGTGGESRRGERFLSRPGSGSAFERIIDDLPYSLLQESWGIWRRAVAHHVLTPRERDAWYEREDQDIAWLLARVAAKEAVRAWAKEKGHLLESVDLEVTDLGEGAVEVSAPGLERSWRVDLENPGETAAARLKDPDDASVGRRKPMRATTQ